MWDLGPCSPAEAFQKKGGHSDRYALTLKIHAFSAALSALFASRTAGWHSMTVIEGCLPQLSCTKQLMPSHLVHDQAPPTDESSCESNTARRLCL